MNKPEIKIRIQNCKLVEESWRTIVFRIAFRGEQSLIQDVYRSFLQGEAVSRWMRDWCSYIYKTCATNRDFFRKNDDFFQNNFGKMMGFFHTVKYRRISLQNCQFERFSSYWWLLSKRLEDALWGSPERSWIHFQRQSRVRFPSVLNKCWIQRYSVATDKKTGSTLAPFDGSETRDASRHRFESWKSVLDIYENNLRKLLIYLPLMVSRQFHSQTDFSVL